MRVLSRTRLIPLVMAFALTGISLPSGSKAQTYPIDCAILLCLSGGWPTSVPCSRARAEFIRRITPWPVEPPLQIWRCPMGATYRFKPQPSETDRIFDVLFQADDFQTSQSLPATNRAPNSMTKPAILGFGGTSDKLVPVDFALRRVQDRADIDISGPEFNFVRSIRVFDVRYAQQYKSGPDGDCNRSAVVVLGTYGTQGDFLWQRSSAAALPVAHVGLELWGDHCPSIYHRSVFVDWHDYDGNYGFEQVNY